jgi:transcriptional regulator with XRE-family HTH domain
LSNEFKEIGQRIKEIRQYFELSQDDFGKRIHITKSSVSLLESGKNNPSDQTKALICSEFGINISYLENGTGEMFVPPEDEVAEYVSMFLEEKNDFFDLILATMRSYKNLDRSGREVLCKTSADIKEHIISEYLKNEHTKKEDD